MMPAHCQTHACRPFFRVRQIHALPHARRTPVVPIAAPPAWREYSAMDYLAPEREKECAGQHDRMTWERARNREFVRHIREQEKQFYERLTKISDQEAQAVIAEMNRSDFARLQRFARFELRQIGYFKPIEGSAAWGRACRMVVKKLMAAGQNISDIEEF
jgi:hypothetical protein